MVLMFILGVLFGATSTALYLKTYGNQPSKEQLEEWTRPFDWHRKI